MVIIALFVGVAVQPSVGLSNNDDTTPPVTTHTLDPPEPDGENGWYVSNVIVTLSATDDMSGVDTTYYRIDVEQWEIYDSPFVISKDGDDILIEYYSVDNAGNVEDVKSTTLDIDQTKPGISLSYDVVGGDPRHGWDFLFTTNATDDISGMGGVEFSVNGVLQETVIGPGPTYEWLIKLRFFYAVFGLIRGPDITEDFVKFFGIIVRIGYIYPILTITAMALDKAGNWDSESITIGHYWFPPYDPGIHLFQNFTLTDYYKGYVGNHFIFALFNP